VEHRDVGKRSLCRRR